MAKVWLIRHAESEGDAEVELTEQGRRHAKAIALPFPTEPSLIVPVSFFLHRPINCWMPQII